MAEQNNSNGPAEGASMPELVKELSSQTSNLVRQEVELAKAELAQKGREAGVGAGLFTVAGVVGFLGAAALTAAIIALLSEAMDTWVAALIVAAVYLTAAGASALAGRDRVRDASPLVPEQAIETTKEDIEWAKSQTTSAGR